MRIESLNCFKNEYEYRHSDYISYSTLKDIEYNPNVLIEPKKDEDTDAKTFGSLVDTLLTDSSSFKDKFYVTSITDTPSEVIGKIIKRAVTNYGATENIQNNKEQLCSAAKDFDYGGSTWTEQRIFDSIVKSGEAYYNEIIKSSGKTVITTDKYMLANNIKFLLTTHEWTKKYFSSTKSSNVEIIYQFRYIFKICGVVCKSAIDILYVNHKTKTIEAIDLKVGSNTFFESYHRFRWDMQGALYRKGLEIFLGEFNEFDNYEILPFKFIHIRTDISNYPVLYEMSDKLYEQVMDGYISINGIETLGVYDLLDDVYYYKSLLNSGNITSLVPRRLQENEGKIIIEKSVEYLPF